jgi:subfamily B ATP-binding cassette protein MsbA
VKLYLRILSYLKPHAGVLAVAVACTFAFAALDAFSLVLLIPFLDTIFGRGSGGGDGVGAAAPDQPGVLAAGSERLEAILDGTVGRFVDLAGDPLEAVQGIILFILAVFLVKNVFDFVRAYLVARVEQGVTRDLRDEVYDHLLELDLKFFGRTRMGQIISRLTHDVEQLRTLVAKQLARILSSVFEFATALYFMLEISWKLTVAAFVVIPATMGLWGPLLKRLRRGDRRVLNLAAEVNAHIQETLSGIRLVKSSAAEAHERARFHGLTGDYFRTFVRTEQLRALAAPLTEMLAALGTVILLWYGARLVVVEGDLSGAAFIAFLGLSMKLYAPVKFMAKFPALVQPGLVGAERIFEFLDAPIEIRDRDGARPFPGLQDEIRFEGVSFAYRPGERVLHGVDLTVPRGNVVALVGPSGAGKTTLVDLLGRFYDPTEGRISIDGEDLREISITSLREALGVVSQETVLFHDTVRANIAYGMDGADQKAVERAARAANAHDFVEALPQGYETVVGERGTELSGGQRQRIAIARAILRDPPILIFDEATSALDTESERLVQDAIERLLAGRTVFVIAHRLSTVQRADRIVVLDRGRVVERGSHEELLAAGGLYRRLYELQFADDGARALGESGGEAGRGEEP